MKLLSIPAAVLAATTLAASPALAQRRGESHENRQAQNRGQAEHRGSTERAQPRAEAPRQQAAAPRAEQRTEPRAQPRAEQRVQPQREVVVPRADIHSGAAVPRGPVQNGVAVPRAVPRYDNRYGGNYNNGNYNNNGHYNNGHYNNGYYNNGHYNNGHYNNGYYNGGHYNGHYDNHYYYNGHYYSGPWRGWYGYAPFRPYYFRPHFSLGFGIYLGYPVPYYSYPYPVPVYGYGAPYGEVSVGPNDTSYGGVALQITPNDAAVYVDGNYAGIVSDFDGSRQPLTLVPGTHHIEVMQNGFEPWAFDVTVQPGMVVPYQGSLRPYEQ